MYKARFPNLFAVLAQINHLGLFSKNGAAKLARTIKVQSKQSQIMSNNQRLRKTRLNTNGLITQYKYQHQTTIWASVEVCTTRHRLLNKKQRRLRAHVTYTLVKDALTINVKYGVFVNISILRWIGYRVQQSYIEF